jgi:hypothetical protein
MKNPQYATKGGSCQVDIVSFLGFLIYDGFAGANDFGNLWVIFWISLNGG